MSAWVHDKIIAAERPPRVLGHDAPRAIEVAN